MPLYVIPAGASGKTDWNSKTAEEIMVDINGMQKYTARITKNVERPDTLCLPDDVFIDISTRQIPNTGYTVAKFIMENAPYLKRMPKLPRRQSGRRKPWPPPSRLPKKRRRKTLPLRLKAQQPR